MPDQFTVRVNGRQIEISAGATVAAAMMIAGQPCRTSVSGEPRGPLCGMGICYECRAMVNGIPHSRTCQMLCEPEMDVKSE